MPEGDKLVSRRGRQAPRKTRANQQTQSRHQVRGRAPRRTRHRQSIARGRTQPCHVRPVDRHHYEPALDPFDNRDLDRFFGRWREQRQLGRPTNEANVRAALRMADRLDSGSDLGPLRYVFHTLADESRLRILRCLIENTTASRSELIRNLGGRGDDVHAHLNILQTAGFVRMTGEGKLARWELVPGALTPAGQLLVEDRPSR